MGDVCIYTVEDDSGKMHRILMNDARREIVVRIRRNASDPITARSMTADTHTHSIRSREAGGESGPSV